MALRFVSGIRMLIDLGGVVPPPAKGQGGWGWPVFRKCGGRGGYPSGQRRGDYPPCFFRGSGLILRRNSRGNYTRVHATEGGWSPIILRDRRVGDGRSSGSAGGGVGTPLGTGGGTTPPPYRCGCLRFCGFSEGEHHEKDGKSKGG